MRTRYEYAVRYRRLGWEQRQVRIFQSEAAACRLADKLATPTERWAPIVELRVERREVGPWTVTAVIADDDGGWR